MCFGMFIILVIWKLATLKLFSQLQPKHRQLYSSAHVDIVMRETDFNKKCVSLGMMNAMHTTKRQSFKKMTCPFKDNLKLLR